MSRTSLLMLMAALLLMTVPSGLAQAQAATVEGTGTAIISDSANGAANASIAYSMTDVTQPSDGTSYEGWLVSDDSSKELSTGVMTVTADGSISHIYTSPDGEDLIKNYDKVLITEEPSGTSLYSSQIHSTGMLHIRHLLSSWPSAADKGILTNLKEQLDLAIVHGNLAKDSDNLDDVKLHTRHVINIIEGEGGDNFTSDDTNPGDGVGIFSYAQDRKHAGYASDSAPSKTTTDADGVVTDTALVTHANQLDINGKNAEDWATEARDTALTVLNQSTVTTAKAFVGPGGYTVISLLEAARNGFDADVDGTIESIAGEGGAQQAFIEAQLMATYSITPGALDATAGTTKLPVSGDPTVPMLAQMALIASLALMATGILLLIKSRRSRVRAY